MNPFCTRTDALAKVQQITIDATSNPNTDEVDNFLLDIASYIALICKSSGYDPESLHDTQSTVALSISSGSAVDIVVASASGMSVGNLVKIEGTESGVPVWEFATITAISSNTLTIATIANNYDAGAYVTVVNNALRFLQALNATGAAWKTAESAFMGVSPNKSELAETLKADFLGSDENPVGLWAIKNIPGLLEDSVDEDEQPQQRSQITSYAEQNDGDSDLEKLEIDYEW